MLTTLIVVNFFPQNGGAIKYENLLCSFFMILTNRFGLRPYRTGTIADLKALLSEMTDVPISRLKLSKVYSHKKFELNDTNSLQSIRGDDCLVGYEVFSFKLF
jgi:hypothetical protein